MTILTRLRAKESIPASLSTGKCSQKPVIANIQGHVVDLKSP